MLFQVSSWNPSFCFVCQRNFPISNLYYRSLSLSTTRNSFRGKLSFLPRNVATHSIKLKTPTRLLLLRSVWLPLVNCSKKKCVVTKKIIAILGKETAEWTSQNLDLLFPSVSKDSSCNGVNLLQVPRERNLTEKKRHFFINDIVSK